MATTDRRSARRAARAVWIVSPFTNFDFADNGRYAYVAERASQAGADVTFFTSAFDHYTKQPKPRPARPGIRFVLVYEPGYRANVSLRRVCSHLVFDVCLLAAAVWETVRRGRPHSILCTLPHNGGALLLGLWAKVLGSRFVVDVHDTWPESLLAVHRLRSYQRPLYRLWRWCADAALGLGDAVFAESRRYAERADRVRRPRGQSAATSIYLGGDPAYYATAGSEGERRLPPEVEQAPFRAAYVGSLGRNYDLETLLQAFRRLQDRYPDAYLVLLGGGELEAPLRHRAATLKVNAWFSGWLSHRDLVGLLRQANYGLNTFAAGGNVAYSYKLNDYLLAGVPVINSLDGEVWEAVERWDLGYNYPAGDVAALAAALAHAYTAGERATHQRLQVRRFAAAHLDRTRIYEPMLEALLAAP